MTRRYAIRSGNRTVPPGEGVYGLVQWEVTMAETLSEVGYATGMYEPVCSFHAPGCRTPPWHN
jgi:arylsulfatase A-like enzyme